MRLHPLFAVGLLALPGFALGQAAPQADNPPARPAGLQNPDQREKSVLAVPP